jgi:multiple sugar transport system substrate-binding protein
VPLTLPSNQAKEPPVTEGSSERKKGAEVKATNQKPIRKRPIFRASLLAGACTVTTLAGTTFTGLAGTGVASASSTVSLQFWNAYNPTDKEASTMANVVLPQFEKENPGIKVTSVVVPYAQLLQKYIAAVAAGDPPAVLRSDIIWVPELASQGVLMNLTHEGWFQPIKNDALPGPLSTNYYRGSYYGMPDDTNTQVLFWNKADFAAAHLSGPPATLSQMFADVPKLTDKAKGQFGLGVDGTDIWNVSPYIWSSGGSFTNTGATTTSGFINGGATESTLTELLGLYKAGDIGTDFLGGSGAVSGETGFPKGQYAMYIDGPWAVPTYQEAKFSNYGTTLFPKGSAGSVSVVGGEDLVIANNVQHPGDTIKLAQFLTGSFAQLQMANQGDLATYKSDSAAEIKQQPYLNIFVQQLETAKARPVSPVYTRIDSDFSNELQEAVAGKLALSNALNAASGQANAAIAGS